ncbi:MAG: glycosyltransferase family 39 protein [Anaerolineae bacterium]|nr:glycosyltransferase family 39 protein [Anaerolineae bacterium]
MKFGPSLLKPQFIMLLSILIIALGLRIWGISFGLPYRYHPDEPQHVVEAAKMLADKTLEPSIFNNPPFYKYVLMAAQAGFLGFSLLSRSYDSIADFAQAVTFDPSPLYLASRVISAIAGTLTGLMVFMLGKTAYRQQVGLMAALFLAVTFLHVRDSHYAVNDALLGLLVTVSLLSSIQIAQRGRKRDYILAAVATGLAFATKYTAVFAVVTLTLAHFFSPNVELKGWSKLKIDWLIGAWILISVAAVAGSPYFLLTPQKVFNDVFGSVYSYGNSGFEGWQIDSVSGYVYYLKSLWWGLGPALFMLSAFGIGIAIFKHRKEDILLLSFPILLYLFMGRQQMFFARFMIPALPSLIVLAAHGVNTIVNFITAKFKWTSGNVLFRPILLSLILIVVLIEPVVTSVRHDYLLTQKDSRTLAKEWVEANIAEGAKIALEWPHHGPPLSTKIDSEPNSMRIYDVSVIGGHGLSDHDLNYYTTQGFDYLITSSNIANVSLMNPAEDLTRKAFYISLDQKLELIHQIYPSINYKDVTFILDEIYGPAINIWERERPGPTIKIYKVQ